MKKAKFVVYFLRKEGSVWHTAGRRRFRRLSKVIRFRSRSYTMDWGAPLYVRGLTRVYALDVDKGTQMGVDSSPGPAPLSPEELDLVVGTKIVRELASSVNRSPMEMLLPIALGAVAGFLAAWIIAGIVWQQRVDELVEMLNDAVVPSWPGSLQGLLGFVRPHWALRMVVPGAC